MKTPWHLILLAVVSLQEVGAQIDRLRQQLEEIRQASTTAPPGSNVLLSKTAAVYDTIDQTIMATRGTWEEPSQERLDRIADVADAIEPYKNVLYTYQLRVPKKRTNANSMGLLNFARPDDLLRDRLLEIARSPYAEVEAARAYAVIINLRLDTPEIRQEIVRRMSEYTNRDDTPAATEILIRAKDWRIKEAVPFYIELLGREFRQKDQKNGKVRLVAESVENMGADAAAVIPYLQRELLRMQTEGADFRDVNTVKRAIELIQQRISPPLLAMNGSGPLNLPSRVPYRTAAPVPAATAPPNQTGSLPPQRQATTPSRAASTSTPQSSAPQSADRTTRRWLSVIIGGVVIGLFIALVWRRR